MSFTARYRGICPSCEGEIEPGEELAWAVTTDGHRLAIHDECHALPVHTGESVVCSACFLEKPCPCDDGL
jgi:hypothetical protein